MPEFQQSNIEKEYGVKVLSLRDKRVHDHESIQQLGVELNQLTDEDGSQKLLFDMTGVEFVSSAVLNKLIVLDKQLKKAGGQLGFCSLSAPVAEVFSITRLNQLFPIFEQRDEAIAGLNN